MNSEEMKAMREDPLQCDAFICNHENHWLAIRRMYGTFFNLNSLEIMGPKRISDFYLRYDGDSPTSVEAFLHSLSVHGVTH